MPWISTVHTFVEPSLPSPPLLRGLEGPQARYRMAINKSIRKPPQLASFCLDEHDTRGALTGDDDDDADDVTSPSFK